MRKIFICYRRTEAEYAAGALGRDLRRHFGDEQVFRDKEDIGGGVAWKRQVLHEIDRDAALLVLMGKDWAGAKDSHQRRRLDDPEDGIRLEIENGIADQATLIPILLENAEMPHARDLPEEIRPLLDLNALRLRDSDWPYDFGKVCKTLERAGFKAVEAGPIGPETGTTRPPAPRGALIKLIASYGLAGMALVAGAAEAETDPDTALGALAFSAAALVLAVLAYRDYRRGLSTSRWPSIGAILFAAFVVLAAIGWAMGSSSFDASDPYGAAAPGGTGVAGRWTAAHDGSQVMLTVDGPRVHMTAATPQGTIEGDGLAEGGDVQISLRQGYAPLGLLNLTLSPDGRTLTGHLTNPTGIDSPMTLRR